MQAANGGILTISASVDNSNGLIVAGLGSTVSLSGTITGGNLAGIGIFTGSGSLIGVTNSSTVSIPGNASLRVFTALANRGVVLIAGSGTSGTAALVFNLSADNQTLILNGGGTISLQNNTYSSILVSEGSYGGTQVVNQDNLIHGAGTIGTYSLQSFPASTFSNQGVISADVAGQTLLLSNVYSNSGTLQAMCGGILSINTELVNSVFNNNGGTIQALDASQVMASRPVTGGSLRAVGTGQLYLLSGASSAASLAGTGSATVAATASLTVPSIQLSGLSVAGQVIVPVGSASNSTLSSLAIANNAGALGVRTYSGFFDLGDNDLTLTGTTEANLRDMVRAWYHGGTHTATGLGSSVAGTGTGANAVTTLAVITNNDGQGGALFPTFDGVATLSADVLVKYTYLGDTNLDGKVDASDLANLLAGMNGHLTGWINGDMNYDGVVNNADLNLLLSGLRGQGAPLGGNGGAGGSVPEPSALLAGLMAVPLTARFRRRYSLQA
jgi:hypothetical protein